MNWLNSISVGRRLGLAFGAMLLIFAVAVGIGIWRLQILAQTTKVLGE